MVLLVANGGGVVAQQAKGEVALLQAFRFFAQVRQPVLEVRFLEHGQELQLDGPVCGARLNDQAGRPLAGIVATQLHEARERLLAGRPQSFP